MVANGDDSSDSEDSSSSDDSSSEDDTLNARRQALIQKRTEQKSDYSGGNAGNTGMVLAQALQPDVRVGKQFDAKYRKGTGDHDDKTSPAPKNLDEGTEIESSDSSSSHQEKVYCKVSFVPKNKRGQRNAQTSGASSKSVNKIVSSKNIGSKSLQERAAQSRRMVIDSTVDVEEEVNEQHAAAKMPSDEDRVDAFAEMEAWRLREKMRVEKFTLH